MSDIEAKFVEWDQMDLPDTVYKYREWNNPIHKTIITQLQVFLSPPTGFEDPLDCKNPIRYDLLTDEEIRWYYYQHSQTENLHFTEKEHRQYADEWFDKAAMRDKEFIKQ